MLLSIPLSKLVSGRRNPRRYEPEAEAHRRLVASIRAFGLLEPLVVRPTEGNSNCYQIIAGSRRLAALKEIHRGSKKDPKIACEVRKVEDSTAKALSLAENFRPRADASARRSPDICRFGRCRRQTGGGHRGGLWRYSQVHPTTDETGDIGSADPGRIPGGKIDTATAEAFATVPDDRQMSVWQELRGNPRHAEQVRNIIANGWIDSGHALFEITKLPEGAVSRDLFGNRVLIERQAFMDAQAEALAAERQALIEEGWAEAVVGRREDVQDRLYAMNVPQREYDEPTERKLKKIASRREKLEEAAGKIDEGDQARLDRVQEKFDALEAEEQVLLKAAPDHFSEATKSTATAFILLDPDGQVRREYRVPRHRPAGVSGGNGDGADASETPKPPTSEDLSDGQLGVTFTHQALAVREALLDNPKARKRVLALILHEKVRGEALAIRHDTNAVTLHAANGNGFSSPSLERLQKRRAELDSFKDEQFIGECDAYVQLAEVSEPKKIDALIDVLTVDCLTAQMLRRTDLVHRLAVELAVDIRRCWRPDAGWLAGYQRSS